MIAEPQTLTQLIAPYIPLITPGVLLLLAWRAGRLVTQIEDRAAVALVKQNEMHKAITNEMPHSLEDIKSEVHGLREDMKLMFQTRVALDAHQKADHD